MILSALTSKCKQDNNVVLLHLLHPWITAVRTEHATVNLRGISGLTSWVSPVAPRLTSATNATVEVQLYSASMRCYVGFIGEYVAMTAIILLFFVVDGGSMKA